VFHRARFDDDAHRIPVSILAPGRSWRKRVDHGQISVGKGVNALSSSGVVSL
jgi:hypothetical protein